MPKIEIEVSDDGKIVGTLPELAQKAFNTGYDEAFGKGRTKALSEAQAQIDAAKAAAAGGDPVAVEKLKAAELENSKLKEAEALRLKNHDEARKISDERHAAELKDRDDKLTAAGKDIERRTERIRVSVKSDIRAAALKAGARDESLAELEQLLATSVDLDKDLNVVVKGTDGKPAVKKVKDAKGVETEQAQTVEGLVTDYLTAHPHHKAGAARRGGGAPGGRSLTGTGGAPTKFDDAVTSLRDNPRDTRAAKSAVEHIIEQAGAHK